MGLLPVAFLALTIFGLVFGCTIIGTTAGNSEAPFSSAQKNIERSWSFGQIVPVALLALPLLSALSAYASKPIIFKDNAYKADNYRR